MKDLLRRLGERIRELRKRKGWSQEEFADVCGVHRTYMGHLERGEKNVSFASIVRVTNALNVTLSELFAGIESEDSTSATQAARRRPKDSQLELDRNRVLKELASLERVVRTLKKIALAPPEPSPTRVPSRQRPGRKPPDKR